MGQMRKQRNLAFSEEKYLEKERVRLKVTPRKVGVRLKRRRELIKRGGIGGELGEDPLRKTRPPISSD